MKPGSFGKQPAAAQKPKKSAKEVSTHRPRLGPQTFEARRWLYFFSQLAKPT